MPSNQPRSNAEVPTSPNSKSTATYSNKDGSKFITVRKPSGENVPATASNQAQPATSSGNPPSTMKAPNGSTPATNAVSNNSPGLVGSTNNGAVTGGVNRKKQKRRQKQAARLAAEQLASEIRDEMTEDDCGEPGHVHHNHPVHSHHHGRHHHHHTSPAHHAAQHEIDYDGQGYDHDQFEPADGEDVYFSDDDGRIYNGPGSYTDRQPSMNGHMSNDPAPDTSTPKKKSKKKKKAKNPQPSQQELAAIAPGGSSTSLSTPSASQVPPPPPPPPPPPTSNVQARSSHNRDRIWNTSTQEERERIKDFWLSLGEEDRRSLVKVEKEAVLRKMKEQQKHSCSCTVCGRKRTAIEEELEVLYDAYYEELEQYANQQQGRVEDGTPMMPPPRRYGHMGRMQPPDRLPPLMNSQRTTRGRVEELGDEEDDDEAEGDEDDFSDEEDEDYSDEEPEGEPRGPAADFFNFGNSLTVQGGILTVADDLLKNDGKKFIEMMEQLAERRMQREEEAQYAASGMGHPSMNMAQHNHSGHNHGPHPDDEDYDDEEDDDYDSQEDEDYDDDEMDTMTEEQRMEEGRRMFQIFAARMFEQRVLTAYREKVAQERQQKLLEELEEESRLGQQREQKKAKEAQKKKDKKKQQKQAKEEEKARKEAEKAAEEAAAREIEEKKAEEVKRKKEEQRKKREAEKKAQEEERLKKEAEKQRRLQEERERQAELERKQREQKEREKKKREEAKKKEREERELKEKEAKEKREKDEKERKERDAKSRGEKEAKERTKKEEQAAQQAAAHAAQIAAQAPKRPALPISVPTPAGMQNAYAPPGFSSPHLHVATPAIPKAPTPVRPRQPSQQGSVGSSPKTPQILPGPTQSVSPTTPVSQSTSLGAIGPPGKSQNQPQVPLHHHQIASPVPSTIGHPPGVPPPPGSGFPTLPPMGMANVGSSQPPPMSGISQRVSMGNDIPLYPHPHQQLPIGTQYRGFAPPNGMPLQPPGHMIRPPPQGRGMFMEGAPGLPQPMSNMSMNPPNVAYVPPRDTMPSHSHVRQPSASTDKPSFENPNPMQPAQPIGRPAPIQRPSSVTPLHRGDDAALGLNVDIDDLNSHLGSSALLEDGDADEPFTSNPPLTSRRGSAALGQRSARLGFNSSPFVQDPIGLTENKIDGFVGMGNGWGAPPMAFGSPLPVASTWSNVPSAGWTNPNAFGVIGGGGRPGTSRPVTVRLLVCQACKKLTASKKNGDAFHEISTVLRQVDQNRPVNEAPVQMRELLDICETEGDAQNGGGFFAVKNDAQGRTFVRHEVDENVPGSGRGNIAPGEIGSPIPSSSVPVFRSFQSGSGIASPSGF